MATIGRRLTTNSIGKNCVRDHNDETWQFINRFDPYDKCEDIINIIEVHVTNYAED